MKSLWIASTVLLFAIACQSNNTERPEKSVQEIVGESKIKNSDIIRNPVSADQPIDTVNVAELSFEEPAYDFGEVREGTIVAHDYHFTNSGQAPLLISSARSTCGCTVPQWPREPIAPGETAEVTVEFNSANKRGKKNQKVTITANTTPPQTFIYLKGEVMPKAGGSDIQVTQ